MLNMENSFQIKLHCNISDPNAIHSLLEMMLDKLKFLHLAKGSVQQLELKLFDDISSIDAFGQSDKIALFKMSNNEDNIMEYSRSKRWDDALLNTVEKIHSRCMQVNPWEKTA